ncbi:MAG: substrate-binding domain-containing protein [Candidatus Binataceae bacterium]
MRAAAGDAVRHARVAHSLNQAELARRAGISRQALGAIESGAYQPSVAVALALSRELGESVEALFAGTSAERISADLPRNIRAGVPVALARVGGRVVAVPVTPAATRLAPVSGLVVHSAKGPGAVEVFRSRTEIDSTLLLAGCDPAVTFLADWLARRRAPACLVGVASSSRAALGALVLGQVHAAGLHLRDSRTGAYNLDAARSALAGRRAVLVNFAGWELGFATAPANPRNLRGFADLARRGITIVNRERGAGARAALDEGLRREHIEPGRLNGYSREVRSHLEVAATVAAGDADCGVAIRVAAQAFGVGFVPLRDERYDIAILERELDTPPVKAMLDALNSADFARQLSTLCAYDTSQTGKVIARIGDE